MDDLERIKEQSPEVIAYRLTQVEKEVGDNTKKLDEFINLYPSKELLDYMLTPFKDAINTLNINMKKMSDKLEEREKRSETERSSLKVALVAALVGPTIATILMLVVLGLQK